jgi:hypothetical protein
VYLRASVFINLNKFLKPNAPLWTLPGGHVLYEGVWPVEQVEELRPNALLPLLRIFPDQSLVNTDLPTICNLLSTPRASPNSSLQTYLRKSVFWIHATQIKTMRLNPDSLLNADPDLDEREA